jgi:uncharacterized protein YdeI (YjbR/CyaY-like superfamily)
MTRMNANPKVDAYLNRLARWKAESEALRKIVLDCQLTEELKWGAPCYTFENKNIVIIHGFKNYCALLFVKGALLRDDERVLIRQTENVQAGRQIRFTDVEQISQLEPVLKAYIREAVEVEKVGAKVKMKPTGAFAVPEEFQAKLNQNPALKTAFGALTPGRQRAYLLYFSAAKQSKTRTARIEKSMPRILDGKGVDDEPFR